MISMNTTERWFTVNERPCWSHQLASSATTHPMNTGLSEESEERSPRAAQHRHSQPCSNGNLPGQFSPSSPSPTSPTPSSKPQRPCCLGSQRLHHHICSPANTGRQAADRGTKTSTLGRRPHIHCGVNGVWTLSIEILSSLESSRVWAQGA